MQRKLAALARRSGENQQANRACRRESQSARLGQQSGQRGVLHGASAIVVERQRAGLREQPDYAEQEKHVADARGEKGLLGRRRRRGLLIPEPDQQVRSEPDQFPAHEQEQQAVRDHHAQHGPGKEREEAEEAREVLVVLHVAHGVDEDQQADKGDHHQHHGRERIEHPAEIDVRRAELEPGEVNDLAGRSTVSPFPQHLSKRNQGKQQAKG